MKMTHLREVKEEWRESEREINNKYRWKDQEKQQKKRWNERRENRSCRHMLFQCNKICNSNSKLIYFTQIKDSSSSMLKISLVTFEASLIVLKLTPPTEMTLLEFFLGQKSSFRTSGFIVPKSLGFWNGFLPEKRSMVHRSSGYLHILFYDIIHQ